MKGMIKIDTERCKGCAYCPEACLASVLAMSNYFNKSRFHPAAVKYANMCPEVVIEGYQDNH